MEIVFAVVIIGISVSALVSGLATAAQAGMVQRDGALADTALRNLAEDAKSAARTCTVGERLALDMTVPDHWTAAVTPVSPACPAETSPLSLTFTVSGPTGETASLDVVVRNP